MVRAVFGFRNALTGNPMPNVECTLDGVTQITDPSGLAIFTTTQGPHQYVIKAGGYKVGPGSVDTYGRPLYDQGEIRIEWLANPSYPWPETSDFYLSVFMVEGTPSPQLGSVAPILIGLGALLLLKGKK